MFAETTWIEVTDSAVKIGLGALIGGLITYITTKVSHNHESRKEFVSRRRNMLDEIIKELDVFAQNLMTYWAVVRNSLAYRSTTEILPKKDIKEIDTKQDQLFNAFSDLSTIESRLLLLGEKSMSDELTAYAKCASEFFQKSHYENPSLTSDIMDDYKTKLRSARQNLILHLSAAYRKNK